jgi:hypothetical protein
MLHSIEERPLLITEVVKVSFREFGIRAVEWAWRTSRQE